MFRVVNVVMAAVFLVSAILQYNDPDPLRWMAVYGAAALVCLGSLRFGPAWVWPLLVAIVALGWAALLCPEALPDLRLQDLVKTMHASTPSIELGREMLGLLIVALWMAVRVFLERRR